MLEYISVRVINYTDIWSSDRAHIIAGYLDVHFTYLERRICCSLRLSGERMPER